MRTKKYAKATAVLTVVAVLALSAPNTFAASRHDLDFGKHIKRSFAFFAQFFSYVPVVNVAKYTFIRDDDSSGVGSFRITGDLMSPRLSKGDR